MNTTTDYSIFKYKSGNRGLVNKHIDKIKDAISKHGYLESCPIIVNENYEILDGQHRFEACKQMGLPIHYVIEENTKQDLLIDLNILQRKWTLSDYVRYYAIEKANPNYQRLAELMTISQLDAATLLTMANDVKIGGTFLAKVKQGELILNGTTFMRVKVLLDNLHILADILNIRISGRLGRAVTVLNQNPRFSWNTMLTKARKYKVKAYQCSTIEEWLEMLVYLYNYQCRSAQTKLKLERI